MVSDHRDLGRSARTSRVMWDQRHELTGWQGTLTWAHILHVPVDLTQNARLSLLTL